MSGALETSSSRIVTAIGSWRAQQQAPLVVAIDGHGAAGKSTIAAAVSEALEATLVQIDDFFRAAGSAAVDGVPMSRYYDWVRLRHEALQPLLNGRAACFQAFDWETDALRPGTVTLEPAAVIVLEGVSASAPALRDLISRAVLVATPESERIERLKGRITDAVWDASWLQEEQAYFATRPPAGFDLVVSGSAAV